MGGDVFGDTAKRYLVEFGMAVSSHDDKVGLKILRILQDALSHIPGT